VTVGSVSTRPARLLPPRPRLAPVCSQPYCYKFSYTPKCQTHLFPYNIAAPCLRKQYQIFDRYVEKKRLYDHVSLESYSVFWVNSAARRPKKLVSSEQPWSKVGERNHDE
jgi:hypothetical protein